MAQSSGETTSTVTPFTSLGLSRLTQFALNTAHIMREPTQNHHQLNADTKRIFIFFFSHQPF